MDTLNLLADREEASTLAGYQPPAVETVLTADALAREVHYAGDGTFDEGCLPGCG
jgi:hypothetical protein